MHRITAYLDVLRKFSRNVRLYFVTASLIGFTIEGVHALLFNLYLLRLGYGPEFVGLINGTGMGVFALVSLPAGRLNQHWGSRRTMLAGIILIVVGYGLLLSVEFDPGSWRDGWMVITYVLVSIGAAVYFVNTAPFLMDVTSLEERNHVFATYAAIGSLAGFTGSLIGGILPGRIGIFVGASLSQAVPYRYALLIATLFLLPAILAVRATTPEPRARPISGKHVQARPASFSLIVLLTLVRLLAVTSMGVVHIFFNVYLDTRLNVSTAQIGVVLAIGRLLSVPAALTVPLLAARWGNGLASLWSSWATVFAIIPLALIPHWSAASLGYMGVMALSAIRYPTFMVYTMDVVSPEQRGIVSGAGEMAAGLSFAFMALSGGYIITSLGFHSLFLTGAILTGVAALIFRLHFRRR